MIHAGTYGATLHYLKAVAAAGTTDATKVVAKMKELPIDDFYTKGTVREDGRVMRPHYLLQVKKPSESKYRFDYLKISEPLTLVSLGLFIAAGSAFSIIIRRYELVLLRQAERALPDR
jgi:hypothetical protein